MSRLPKQTKRNDLIRRFRTLGWSGPHRGRGKHPEFMAKGSHVQSLPNVHRGDIGEGLLRLILEQAGISTAEWLGEDLAG